MKIKKSIEDYEDGDEALEKLSAPADWNGPVENRRCTDLFFLFLIILSWAAMTWIGIYATHNGDYRLVLYPLDYDGNVCGTDYNGRDMMAYPYLMYINHYGGVCVKECPALAGKTQDNLTDVNTLITYTGIWQSSAYNQSELLADFIEMADYSYTLNASNTDGGTNSSSGNSNLLSQGLSNLFDYNNFQCTEELCFPSSTDISESWNSIGINQGNGFAYYATDTYPLLQRCFLTDDAKKRLSNLTEEGDSWTDIAFQDSDLEVANDFISNLFGDIWTARFWILGFGFGLSLVVSFIYMLVLRVPALLSSIVWISILAIICLFAGAGYYTSQLVTEWEEADPPVVREKQIQYTTITSYVLYGITAVLFLLAICLRKQIQLAIFCVKQAGRAINSMILIFLIPVIQGIGLLLFVMVWTYYGSYLASLGEITVTYLQPNFGLDFIQTDATDLFTIPVRSYTYSDTVTQFGRFLLFCFFWTSSFILAIGEMCVAMAISKWYFTADKSLLMPLTPLKALWSTIIYHLGTCAFGSLLIAIIKFLRSILAFFQKRIAELSNKKVADALLCACQCCLCCLERCVQFINENAYIQCAIFATPFWESGKKSFFLILRNAARISAVSYVSAAVLIIGKLFISCFTTFSAHYAIVNYLELELHSFAGPVTIIFIISYYIADMFMDIFDISILCVLHCFIADEEMFGGRARYAEDSLSEFVDKHGSADD